jgi:hypothetical protein
MKGVSWNYAPFMKRSRWPANEIWTWLRSRPRRNLRFAASWTTGSFCTSTRRREREAKKHQKTITVKEVKFRINVDDHDYETKKNHVLRFLDEGDKVKATIFFRGREMTRQSLGRQILERLIKDIGETRLGGIQAAAGGQHPARDSGAEERHEAKASRAAAETLLLRNLYARQRRASFSGVEKFLRSLGGFRLQLLINFNLRIYAET